MNRRSLLVGLGAACAAPAIAEAQQPTAMTVYKSPACGCCSAWMAHARRAGFAVRVVDVDDLAPVKARFRVPAPLVSCHTSVVGRAVFEGHVPLTDVRRFLRQPEGVGLAVPGMPVGSPGMEAPGAARQPFQVLAFDRQGRTRLFARHG